MVFTQAAAGQLKLEQEHHKILTSNKHLSFEQEIVKVTCT